MPTTVVGVETSSSAASIGTAQAPAGLPAAGSPSGLTTPPDEELEELDEDLDDELDEEDELVTETEPPPPHATSTDKGSKSQAFMIFPRDVVNESAESRRDRVLRSNPADDRKHPLEEPELTRLSKGVFSLPEPGPFGGEEQAFGAFAPGTRRLLAEQDDAHAEGLAELLGREA